MRGKSLFFGRYGGYSLEGFRRDLISGLIVGIIAIPLGMGFAIASGVNPEYGIYTTIVAGIIISLFGGSKFQIGGPTGAFIPILLGIVMTYGYENLLIAGFLAGIILLIMGFFKLGSLIRYIPKPVIIGFTAGIAVIIFFGQIPNFFGLKDIAQHEYFHQNFLEYVRNIHLFEFYSVLTALICLTLIVVCPKLLPKVPSPLIGLIGSTIIATFLYPGQVATIGSTFGDIPSGLPEFQFPEITLEKIQLLIIPALAIAMLGGIESLLSAVVADSMTNSKHNSNRELVGQGVANIVTPMFGGIPATGAIARTATNIKSGAVSPISGVIHGMVVLIILLLFAPYASNIPLASMAPILMVVAWNMSERKVFIELLKMRTADSLVIAVTFFLTVFVNLTVAIPVGLFLAVVSFIKRMSDIIVIEKVIPNRKKDNASMLNIRRNCSQVSIYNINGPLFFGSAEVFEQLLMKEMKLKPQVLILNMSHVPYMDTTGEQYFSKVVKNFSKNRAVIIVGMKSQPRNVINKTGLNEIIGEAMFYDHIEDALNFVQIDSCQLCNQSTSKNCLLFTERKAVHRKKERGTVIV